MFRFSQPMSVTMTRSSTRRVALTCSSLSVLCRCVTARTDSLRVVSGTPQQLRPVQPLLQDVQVFTAIFRDDDHVFHAYAAELFVVEAGLDGQGVAGDEFGPF